MVITMAHVALLKLISDIIIGAAAALKRVGTMTEEEVQAAIPQAEALSKSLKEKIEAH